MTDDPGAPLDKRRRAAALARRRRRRVGTTLSIVVAVLVFGYFASGDEKKEGGGADKDKDRPAAACDAEPPPEPSPKQYEAPGNVLQRGIDYGAVITTSCGKISIDLLEGKTPINVNSFVFLAQEGFFDGLEWYRVERNSVIQTGDPNNVVFEEPDGPGYTIEDELPEEPKEYIFGAVAIGNEGRPDSGGSQFFIVIHENRPAGYQPAYSIFGRVDESSYEVLREIGKQPTRGGREPLEAVRPTVPIFIESIEIVER